MELTALWKKISRAGAIGSTKAPVRRMTVAFAKAADIRVDACRKHLARNWERSEGESGAQPTRSLIASCCGSSRKAKAHRNFAAWEPIPPKQPTTKGKGKTDSSIIVLMLAEFFILCLCKGKVVKHSSVSIPSGLPIPISSNHGD